MELLNNPRRKVLAVIAVAVMVLAAGMVALLVASSAWADSPQLKFAFARIMDAEGDAVGATILTQRKEKVRVFAWTKGLTPGKHGIHFHAIGKCDDAAFASAGSHFNPELKKHGLRSPEGPHAGDLPNLKAHENGLGILHAKTDRIGLVDGPKSLFDADGSALVIHAAKDDQVTDPTGNSGDRIACGVIRTK